MKHVTKVAFALVCIIAISSIGLANAAHTAAPLSKSAKQCSLVYWTSDDSTLYDVTRRNNFILPLNDNPDTWYYLGIKSVKPDIVMDPQYSYALFAFFLDQESVASNEAFQNYWDAKLADPMADGQQWAFMLYWILHGDLPMFALKATPTGQYMLVDYLQLYLDNADNLSDYNNFIFSPLRINGDYPHGTYTFVGHSAIDENYMVGVYPDNNFDLLDNPLSEVSFTITFR